MTATVYVIETGDYEQRHVMAVAASVSAAVDHIKGTYGEPYRVTWDEPEQEGDSVTLVGHFDAVQGFSVKHDGYFDITPEDLIA